MKTQKNPLEGSFGTNPQNSRAAETGAFVTDKRGFAARWHFSVRHVDNLLAQGMPHLKCGRRRVRLVTAEADAWMKERFGTRRLGSVHSKSESV
jgi:hypothetical protein